MRKFIFFLCFVTLFGCTSQMAIVFDNVAVYKVEATDYSFSWDEYVDRFEIVPLETNTSSIFGELHKGRILGEDIYIFDYQHQLLLNFDISGKFKRKISGKGRGPEDYYEVRDFNVVGDNIYILDFQRIHRFCKLTGKIEETWSFDTNDNFNPINMCIFDKKNYYLWDSNPYTRHPEQGEYYKMQKMQGGNVIERFFKYEYPLWDEPKRFYMIDEQSCYIRPIEGENIVYKLTRDSLIASFKIDFGRMSVTIPEVKEIRDINQRNAFYRSNKFKGISNVFEVKNYIYFTCIGPNGMRCVGLICKITGNINLGMPSANPTFFASDGTFLYGYYSQSSIETLNKYNVRHCFDAVWLDPNQSDSEENMILVKVLLK